MKFFAFPISILLAVLGLSTLFRLLKLIAAKKIDLEVYIAVTFEIIVS